MPQGTKSQHDRGHCINEFPGLQALNDLRYNEKYKERKDVKPDDSKVNLSPHRHTDGQNNERFNSCWICSLYCPNREEIRSAPFGLWPSRLRQGPPFWR